MGKSTRKPSQEHFTKMIRNTMETPAWRALSPVAQALYPWLKLQWRGLDNNNNGKIKLSIRQAQKCMGIGSDPKPIRNAFYDLQAKGFIRVNKVAVLGIDGAGQSTSYEITELAMPHSQGGSGSRQYKEWSENNDCPVVKARVNNPNGKNGKKRKDNILKMRAKTTPKKPKIDDPTRPL